MFPNRSVVVLIGLLPGLVWSSRLTVAPQFVMRLLLASLAFSSSGARVDSLACLPACPPTDPNRDNKPKCKQKKKDHGNDA